MPATAPSRFDRWTLCPGNDASARSIAERHGMHPAVARTLAGRGWSPGAALDEFLDPAVKHLRMPGELAGMDAAVERLLRARADRERVWVYGDYDVDGVSSTALLITVLRFLGMEPRFLIPNRFTDGYGMTTGRVEEIAAGGATLIVTVDTGVTAVAPIARARELGIDVIVTDHHLAGDELPNAVAIINPNRPDAFYEHGRLCGVAVAFKLAHGLLRASGIDPVAAKKFLMTLLDFVVLGTIADVAPLVGENRIFAHRGLEALRDTRRPGLMALMSVAGVGSRPVTSETIGFGLGPRLNAAGRTGDATLALELLLEEDPARAQQLAAELDRLNRHRRQIEDDILVASCGEAERAVGLGLDRVLVVAGEGWHIGVVGIVASRLVDKFNVPAIVMGIEDSVAKGSARSVPGFDLHEALAACGEHLLSYGGHAAAAGLRLHTDNYNGFREAINAHATERFADIDCSRSIAVDGEVTAGEIDWCMVDDLRRLEPFGEQNPGPVFLVRGLRPWGTPRVLKEAHLKVSLHGGPGGALDAIGFGAAPLRDVFSAPFVDILCRPFENTFNGRKRLELELFDARPAVV